MNEYDVMELDL